MRAVRQRLCPEVPVSVPQPHAPRRREAVQVRRVQPAVRDFEQPEDSRQVGRSEILQMFIHVFI